MWWTLLNVNMQMSKPVDASGIFPLRNQRSKLRDAWTILSVRIWLLLIPWNVCIWPNASAIGESVGKIWLDLKELSSYILALCVYACVCVSPVNLERNAVILLTSSTVELRKAKLRPWAARQIASAEMLSTEDRRRAEATKLSPGRRRLPAHFFVTRVRFSFVKCQLSI